MAQQKNQHLIRIMSIATLIFVFALLSTFTPQAAFASDKTDVAATVHLFFDNLDPKSLDKALAACDSPVAILDEFPPHAWYGPTACADWWKGLLAYDEKSGITDGDAKLGVLWTVDVTGDRAYFVAPAIYTFKQHGKPMKEAHAVFTAALRRTDAGWRITAWAWSKH
jgi:ketosteroid isomerase-like protein